MPALLCYDATDPFAVRIAFGDVGDDSGVVGQLGEVGIINPDRGVEDLPNGQGLTGAQP